MIMLGSRSKKILIIIIIMTTFFIDFPLTSCANRFRQEKILWVDDLYIRIIHQNQSDRYIGKQIQIC